MQFLQTEVLKFTDSSVTKVCNFSFFNFHQFYCIFMAFIITPLAVFWCANTVEALMRRHPRGTG